VSCTDPTRTTDSLAVSQTVSGAPLAYTQADIPSHRQIQANIMTYMQIHELIHADTTNALNRYRADTYIQYDTYRYMKFCMLYISGYTFLYVSCMCMYDGCIRRLKGSYIQHTCKIHTIYQSICPVSCMYLMFLGVCMCMYVYI
jgi:hypothetical protein